MYPFEEYDKEGFLRPPVLLWCVWLFLCRGWVIFVMSTASRSTSNDVLPLLLPSMQQLYGLMLSAIPIALMMWLVGLRSAERPRLSHGLRHGHSLTFLTVVLQLAMAAHEVFLNAGHFSWFDGVTLLMLFWSLLYMHSSKRAKASFEPGAILTYLEKQS